METILLIFQFVIVIILTITVLLQKSSSIGLGAYSGSNESLFGAKGPAGFLAKFTFFLGVLFIINTLALGYMYNKTSNKSVLDRVDSKNIVTPQKNIENNSSLIPEVPVNSVPATPKDTNQTK
ncbi:protein-export membrane protein [Campylobacter sputorum subsp. bubulus]|uniref:Protein-export membrane protein SecG n=1 Tax=Campylobacter sputorum subsp. sputorum TaxID=32024 RepID=A0A381DIS8_9BACT|nr:preprotein translocase subunit SecG [Campylobacter sputorum]ASM35632.1 preprotein translocase SecYEG, SecG subunit [Campylobacter sputorum aubsp. sputorum RM3237]KAB0582638.1 preprotein translocase subunit SecG [Campylobacter sputorum subsp. sputorum]QEL05824.1 preprotein translocase SecYEG, SecG subunit [Campylobacter sputorum subsp. sputorum]SUX08002.1 protein-export membrane protein [Campylobacter sputorum subsp. bubulus]SUX10602.1 protein-export membrane protein [Campylobacter sputorum 